MKNISLKIKKQDMSDKLQPRLPPSTSCCHPRPSVSSVSPSAIVVASVTPQCRDDSRHSISAKFKDEEVWVIKAPKPKYIPGLTLKEKKLKGFETHADEDVKKYHGKLGHPKRLAEIETDRLFTELCKKDSCEILRHIMLQSRRDLMFNLHYQTESFSHSSVNNLSASISANLFRWPNLPCLYEFGHKSFNRIYGYIPPTFRIGSSWHRNRNTFLASLSKKRR
ncbi:unnamed protein product [Lactuca virosa]|uniref:Uncharacterized protein n=1 Tax=Lactuca virosa TaxID=75947 RepID=A0AAU9P982_9ASTR|nr:unnamed protein product [Lactuca virosa]